MATAILCSETLVLWAERVGTLTGSVEKQKMQLIESGLENRDHTASFEISASLSPQRAL